MKAEGGWRAYFKGNGANVVKIAPETAMKLTFNDGLRKWVAKDPAHMTPWERMATGGLAGATAQGILYPLELIRTRLAVCPTHTYRGIVHAGVTIWHQEGLRAFYRGLAPAMIGILPYAGVDIAVFEMIKDELLQRHRQRPPAYLILAAGMFSSTLAVFFSYPFALIRTRLQAQGVNGSPLKYHSMTDVAVKTVRTEGVRGLYKGLIPNLVKLAPAAGISWFVFEEGKKAMGVR